MRVRSDQGRVEPLLDRGSEEPASLRDLGKSLPFSGPRFPHVLNRATS